MRMFAFFSRNQHSAATADAYADGELQAAERERFGRHLGGCERCQALVAEARLVRQAVASLPELSAPRSFAITPAMAAASRPTPVRAAAPLVLTFARAGAALSVAAFATVAAVTALDSSENEGATSSADDSAGLTADGAPLTESAAAYDTDKGQVEASPTAALAPASSGGATGSGNATVQPLAEATPVPPSTGARETPTARVTLPQPQPPSTGPGGESLTVPDSAGRDNEAPEDAFTDMSAQGMPGEESGSDDSRTLLWAFGALAAACVAGLAVLEVARRRRA